MSTTFPLSRACWVKSILGWQERGRSETRRAQSGQCRSRAADGWVGDGQRRVLACGLPTLLRGCGPSRTSFEFKGRRFEMKGQRRKENFEGGLCWEGERACDTRPTRLSLQISNSALNELPVQRPSKSALPLDHSSLDSQTSQHDGLLSLFTWSGTLPVLLHRDY